MQELDLIVVGGGLTGAAVARDGALRGLRTLLVEERDLGAGASGALPELLDAGPLGCSAARRQRLRQELASLRDTAGSLLQRQRMLWPVDDGADLLRVARRAARSRVPDPAQAAGWRLVDGVVRRTLEPALVDGGPALVGVGYALDPQRLIALCARDAAAHGALIHNGWRAIDVIREGARVVGVVALELRTGRTQAWRGRVVVNAAGPGLQHLATQLGHRLPLTVVPRVFARFDRRLSHCAIELGDGVRLLPEPRATWVGPLPGLSRSAGLLVPVTADELRQLRRFGGRYIPALREAPVTGLRVPVQARLGRAEDRRPAAARVPRIVDHADHGCPGMISVVGGLLLEHRWVAQRVVDRVAARCQSNSPCRTHHEPLPGGRGRCDEERWGEQYAVSPDALAGLVRRHGSEAHALLQLTEEMERGGSLACRCNAITEAELLHVARHEHVGQLADLLRRTGAGQGACLGARCLERCARTWRTAGNRSVSEMQRELEEVRHQRAFEVGAHLAVAQIEALNLNWREPHAVTPAPGAASSEPGA